MNYLQRVGRFLKNKSWYCWVVEAVLLLVIVLDVSQLLYVKYSVLPPELTHRFRSRGEVQSWFKDDVAMHPEVFEKLYDSVKDISTAYLYGVRLTREALDAVNRSILHYCLVLVAFILPWMVGHVSSYWSVRILGVVWFYAMAQGDDVASEALNILYYLQWQSPLGLAKDLSWSVNQWYYHWLTKITILFSLVMVLVRYYKTYDPDESSSSSSYLDEFYEYDRYRVPGQTTAAATSPPQSKVNSLTHVGGFFS